MTLALPMKCPTCHGFQGTNVWTCICTARIVDPVVEGRLADLRRYVEDRLDDVRAGAAAAIVADVNGEVRRVRAEIAILEARIADQDDLIRALVSVVGAIAARKHPLFCMHCRTAYALTDLRLGENGKTIELLCPTCGPIPWRGGE